MARRTCGAISGESVSAVEKEARKASSARPMSSRLAASL